MSILATAVSTQQRAVVRAEAVVDLDAICANLDAETPITCHRDFMVRNLMPLPDGGLIVLDHQDLRPGPPAYDVASLLNDTLFPPPQMEAVLLEEALLARMRVDRLSYHRAAAQRTLKAVGTYTSFALRGAGRHLPLVPPTLGRCPKSPCHTAREGKRQRDKRRGNRVKPQFGNNPYWLCDAARAAGPSPPAIATRPAGARLRAGSRHGPAARACPRPATR